MQVFSREDLNQLYRYCVALTGDEDEAYDLLQDSFEKFLRKGRDVHSAKAYFRGIIRNHFIDQYRKGAKHGFTELDENIISTNETSLESLIANKEEARFILNALDFHDRELLYLWAVEEYTAKELADLLKSPRGTILSKLHRLKIKIKQCLENGYEKDIKRKHQGKLRRA